MRSPSSASQRRVPWRPAAQLLEPRKPGPVQLDSTPSHIRRNVELVDQVLDRHHIPTGDQLGELVERHEPAHRFSFDERFLLADDPERRVVIERDPTFIVDEFVRQRRSPFPSTEPSCEHDRRLPVVVELVQAVRGLEVSPFERDVSPFAQRPPHRPTHRRDGTPRV